MQDVSVVKLDQERGSRKRRKERNNKRKKEKTEKKKGQREAKSIHQTDKNNGALRRFLFRCSAIHGRGALDPSESGS